MKIFGFDINRKKKIPQKQVVTDEAIDMPEIQVTIPAQKTPSVLPRIISPVLGYHNSRLIGRGYFQPSEYNLAEVGRIEDTESFVRRAFDKKIALMFKEGYDFIGANPKTIKYLKIRLAQIAAVSRVSTLELFRQMGLALIKKSNSFTLKIRSTKASGGRERQAFGVKKTIKPVAAYFQIPPETMEFSMKDNYLDMWRQRMPSGQIQVYDPEDIIHCYANRKEGFIFGTPSIIPVVDDIRALRKIEENIEMLVYQHLFPLFQYKVGTPERPAGFTETGEREIDLVRREIELMPAEGGIVTPERHEIIAIGAEGRALRADGYLAHYKKRVISGLGLSAVDLGEGDTSNHSTSETMSGNLVDDVKDFQQILEMFINQNIINELLLEADFPEMEDVLSEENKVCLKFKEIDIDYQIKKEAHYADQFNKDMITHDEARHFMGREPLLLPTPEEIESEQDLHERYPAWYKTRWKMFEEPKLLISSIDEPYSAAAKAVAESRVTAVTQKGVAEHQTAQKASEDADRKAKAAKKVPTAKGTYNKDSFVSDIYIQLKEDLSASYTNKAQDKDWVSSIVRAAMSPLVDKLASKQLSEFKIGYSKYSPLTSTKLLNNIGNIRSLLHGRSEKFISKLTNDTVAAIKRNITDTSSDPNIIIRAIFDTLEYRAGMIEDVEIPKARSFGEFTALRHLGHKHVRITIIGDSSCEECKTNHTDLHLTDSLTIDDMPPCHPHCGCKLQVEDKSDAETVPEELKKSEQVDSCPKCGKTAIRVKDTPDIFKCRACGHSYRKMKDSEEMDNKFDTCMEETSGRLRKRHPDWNDVKIKSSAYQICNAYVADDKTKDGAK